MLHSLVRAGSSFAIRNLVGSRLVTQRGTGLSLLKSFSSVITTAAAGKAGRSAVITKKAVSSKFPATATCNTPESGKVIKTKKYADGCMYEGGWSGDMWEGHGKLTSATGQIWEGEFKEGKFHKGSGALVFPGGDL